MAKNTETWRTKDQMCNDLAVILNNSDLHLGTKPSVIDSIQWTWTLLDGKYKGYIWSKSARAQWNETGSVKGLRHKHVIPRSVVKKLILELQNPTQEDVLQVLEKYCLGVVATVDEDKKLNQRGLRSKMPPQLG